jgi:small GTP-binding protein
MSVPQVVIVGRPNVGKSSLLNWLAGRRISIVDDQAGVTRDRITHFMEHNARFFELVDTGGIGIQDTDNLSKQVEEQVETALETADLVLFVVDSRAGIAHLDEDVARRLRYIEKPVICVANKTDDEQLDYAADEFYKLGRGRLIKVSTHQNRGKQELLDAIHAKLPLFVMFEAPPEEPTMKVAIVGRRNTGKSTFVNTLAKAERVIVSEIPGTTRDSVDVRFELDGKTFMAIDTAGVRRHRSIRSDLDFYSFHRAQRSIRLAKTRLVGQIEGEPSADEFVDLDGDTHPAGFEGRPTPATVERRDPAFPAARAAARSFTDRPRMIDDRCRRLDRRRLFGECRGCGLGSLQRRLQVRRGERLAFQRPPQVAGLIAQVGQDPVGVGPGRPHRRIALAACAGVALWRPPPSPVGQSMLVLAVLAPAP